MNKEKKFSEIISRFDQADKRKLADELVKEFQLNKSEMFSIQITTIIKRKLTETEKFICDTLFKILILLEPRGYLLHSSQHFSFYSIEVIIPSESMNNIAILIIDTVDKYGVNDLLKDQLLLKRRGDIVVADFMVLSENKCLFFDETESKSSLTQDGLEDYFKFYTELNKEIRQNLGIGRIDTPGVVLFENYDSTNNLFYDFNTFKNKNVCHFQNEFSQKSTISIFSLSQLLKALFKKVHQL